MTYSRIIYGLTNWKDMECDDNLICIDSEYFEKDKDKPHYFLKKYSWFYFVRRFYFSSKPHPKFSIKYSETILFISP